METCVKSEQVKTTVGENHGGNLAAALQQVKISSGEAGEKQRFCTTNGRVLKFSCSARPTSVARTPKPPTVPKSRSFYKKPGRQLDTSGRLGGDGESCEEINSNFTDEDSLDYCAIERLPGDGCFSESTDDYYEASNLSDGFEEEEMLDNLEEDSEEILCEDSSISISSGSVPSTASQSRASSAATSTFLQREKLGGNALSAKRHSSAGSVKIASAATKSHSVNTVNACWTENTPASISPCLTKSLFPNVPPTIHFTVEGERVQSLSPKTKRLLKWKMSTITPNVVKLCIARVGFRPTKRNDWLGYWGKHMKAAAYKTIRDFQKVNHFPGTFQIGRKDRLWKNLLRLQTRHGKKDFGFIPQTYVLPHDIKNLKRAWEDGGNKHKWILKPPASARGIGIRVIHKWNQIPKKKPVIVQKYLSKPFLINGRKFDLRIYVFISSFDPLCIYVFEDGLTRFATCKYSSSNKNLSNKFMHLTNYSINKKNGDAYIPNNDEDACQGHKWSLKALWGYLKRMGVNTTKIWENIKDIIVKTLISCESMVNLLIKQNVKNSYCCNELFGFDIMLDQNLKPWILEVNISPSLHSTSQLDMNIKGQMIRDLFNISGFRIPETTPANTTSASNGLLEKPKVAVTPDQKAKHAFYVNYHNDELIKGTVLDILTTEDIRILIEAEDEYSRRGCFQRVFPSEISHKYLKYFESARYRNILLDEWVKKYLRQGRRMTLGIALLCTYAQQGIHQKTFTNNANHQWCAPPIAPVSPSLASCTATTSRSLSAPATARRTEEKTGATKVVLPKIKRKTVRYHLSSKQGPTDNTRTTKSFTKI